ncbi:MAG TPA: hypothetical protein VK762_31195 [Polyangiaceae bacterium]|nr:hypothetical protein [Polyangiaceae bacterium]
MMSKRLCCVLSLAASAGAAGSGCGSKASAPEAQPSEQGGQAGQETAADAGSAVGVGVGADEAGPTQPTQGPSSQQAPTPAGKPTQGGALPPDTGLPELPLMTHVQAVVAGNSATISFDPVPGATDYRVYVLPQKSAVQLAQDGSLAGIDNATYRCAGLRAAPGIWVDNNQGPPAAPIPNWIATDTMVDQEIVQGVDRTMAMATLGYAFTDPAAGTVPIYAAGDPAATADNYGYGIREAQTRGKTYVQDSSSLLAKGWRDDGVAFYALASSASTACGNGAPVPVYTKSYSDGTGTSTVYYGPGAEATARGAGTPSFYLCPSQTTGSQPVMRAYYQLLSPGGNFGRQEGHDELALGQERFDRTRCQGSNSGACATAPQSLWQVHWANIQGPTQLVVEALDAGCPFQGLMGPTSMPATLVNGDDNNGNGGLLNDPISTFAQLQSKAPNGEVFLNGTFDGSPTPHPIARALVNVSPEVRPAMDFASNFAGPAEQFTESRDAQGNPDCGITPTLESWAGNPDTCDGSHRMTSPTYDVLFFGVQDSRYAVGQTQGELWTAYSGLAGGKFRIAPKGVTGTMSDSNFLHAAMEVTSFSTGRRYPQIMISEQDFETSQWLLERSADTANPHIGSTMILQPIDSGNGRPVAELELCSQRNWQVNDQCPWFLLEKNDPATPSQTGPNNPHPDLFDRLQDDRSARWDLYASTERAYVFLDSQPYACVDLAHRKATESSGAPIVPTPTPPKDGTVTVAFGDVMYHAGAEADYFTNFSPFHLNHELFETVRHFDYIGWKSGESAPAWDESRFPCITQMFSGTTAGTQTPESGN